MLTPLEQSSQLDYYRVALVQPRAQVLLVEDCNGALRLPSIGIRLHSRQADQLSNAIHQQWNFKSVVIDILPPVSGMHGCAVVEVLSCDEPLCADRLVPVLPNERDILNLAASERDTLHKILCGDTTGRSPFSRVGSIEEIQEWIRASVPDRHIEFTGNVRWANAGGSFALLRLGVWPPPALWLKATGTPNKHEFAVTVKLAALFPNCLPPIVATRPDWNAWLMEEAGQPLETCISLGAFEQATHCLVRLQLGSAGHIETLLESGCFDQRMAVLRASLPRMFHYLKDAMTRQTSVRVAPMTPRRMEELNDLLNEACDSIEAIGIPDTLIHNDINAGNILFDGSKAVFADWAEAYIGNPFFSFHHLRMHTQQVESSHVWEKKVDSIYLDHWRNHIGAAVASRALALTQPLAIASYLIGRDTGFDSPVRNEPHCEAYARSLARHMDRAVRAADFLEALCQ